MSSIKPRPHVTLKIAQTLDGRIATRTGHSRWVSSPASRAVGHALRASHDAVLVGIGTVLVDNPQLTVRLAAGRDPIRVVIDSSLRVPLNGAVLALDGIAVKVVTLESGNTIAADAIRARGAEVVTVPGIDGRVDLAIALEELRLRGIESVLVEGGAKIATEFLRLRLVDDLVLFIAAKVIGTGVDAFGDLGITDMVEAVQFSSTSVEWLEGDIIFRGKPAWPNEAGLFIDRLGE